MTRISFIMPSFNRACYIARSIDSVLAQMDEADELTVVDDGSTDGTMEVLARYGDRLRTVRQDNAGKSVALNRALAMTDGEYVWVCDDDDLLLPGAVARLLGLMERDRADMAFGRYTRFKGEGAHKVDMGTGYWPDLTQGAVARHILEDAFVMHNGALVRRDAYERAGPFDPAMLRSQDYEMFVRLALQGSIAHCDDVIFEQRKHDGVRGPQVAAHRAAHSDNVWQRFDRMIFEKVRAAVPLAFFESLFDGSEPQISERAALLQRGCVMARHAMWPEALDDFERAARTGPAAELHPLERAVCRRAVAGKHGFEGLLEPVNRSRMHQLGNGDTVARAIFAQVATGMLWRVRGDDPAARTDALRFLARPSSVLAAARARSTGRSVCSQNGYLAERNAPDPVDDAVIERLMPAGTPPVGDVETIKAGG